MKIILGHQVTMWGGVKRAMSLSRENTPPPLPPIDMEYRPKADYNCKTLKTIKKIYLN